MQRSYSNQFITLTYANTHLPSGSNLDKRDIQLFFKRLRKTLAIGKSQSNNYLPDQPIRYICVGEYGELRQRPHYHLLLFNAPDNKTIEQTWNMGRVSSTPITTARIRYVFKYISKPKQGLSFGRTKEFQLTSKGIGANYLTPRMIEYHNRAIENCYITKPDGFTLSIPKYYKNKLYTEEKAKLVTAYQQQRIDVVESTQIANLMYKFRIDEKTARQKLELSKLNSKFENKSTPTF